MTKASRIGKRPLLLTNMLIDLQIILQSNSWSQQYFRYRFPNDVIPNTALPSKAYQPPRPKLFIKR